MRQLDLAVALLALGPPAGAAQETLLQNFNSGPEPDGPLAEVELLGSALGHLFFASSAETGAAVAYTLDDGTDEVRALSVQDPDDPTLLLPDEVYQLGPNQALLRVGGLTDRPLWSWNPSTGEALPLGSGFSINSGSSLGLAAGSFESLGGVTYFVGDDTSTGRELWRTDGTPAGTRVFEDLSPGSMFSAIQRPFTFKRRDRTFFKSADRLFYFGNFAGSGLQLRSIAPGAAASQLVAEFPAGVTLRDAQALTAAAGPRLVFIVGNRLWSSDGTTAGTAPVLPAATFTAEELPGSDGARAILRTGSLSEPWRLWTTDGTLAGTRLEVEGPTWFEVTEPIESFAGGLTFRNSVLSPNVEGLFWSDANAGVPQLVDQQSGLSSIGPIAVEALARLFYLSNSELSAYGGPTLGAVRIPAPAMTPLSTEYLELAEVGTHAYFVDRDAHLWRTDGSASGTAMVPLPFDPAPEQGSDPTVGPAIGTAVAVSASFGPTGRRVYVSASEGVPFAFATGLGSGAPGGDPESVGILGALDSGWILSARNAQLGDQRPRLLEAATLSTSELGPPQLRTDGELPIDLEHRGARRLRVGQQLYFTARDASIGTVPQLAVTDGTSAGTRLLTAGQPPAPFGPPALEFDELTEGPSGELYFRQGGTIWRSDGTAAGTAPWKPSVLDRFVAQDLVLYRDALHFTAFEPASFRLVLVRTDGTATGTDVLLSMPGSGGPAFPAGAHLAVVDDALLFAGPDLRLLQPDGSWTLLTTSPGVAFGQPLRLHPGQGPVAYVDVNAPAILDAGTSEPLSSGLYAVTAAPPALRRVAPRTAALTVVSSDGRALFGRFDPPTGVEPWVTDGTLIGTRLLVDSLPGVAGSAPGAVARRGSQALFPAQDGVVGRELHALDLPALGGFVAEPYGQGCGLLNSPELRLESDLALGAPASVALSSAAPLSACVLYAAAEPAAVPLGLCTLLLSGLLAVGTGITDDQGRLQLDYTLTSNPVWLGEELYLQAAVLAPGGPLAGLLELSNGLELVFGQ